MSLVLQSSGGGSVTIQEPSTASNLTLSLPAVTGTSVIQNGSNNLLMNSGYGSDAVAYGCRAWINFNGTGTPAIRASGNVTSITDNGTGDYTVNFTTALPDVNYSVAGTAGRTTASNDFVSISDASPTVSALRVRVSNGGDGTANDTVFVNIVIFR